MGKDKTVTQTLDPQSQQYVDEFLRPLGQRGAADIQGLPAFGPESYKAFMDPFQQEVISSAMADFERQRGLASRGSRQAGASSFGGSRQAVLEGTRLGEVDRAEASTLANLRSQGFQQANQLAFGGQQANIMQIIAALKAGNLGLGPTGTQSIEQGDIFRDVAGAGITAASLFA